MNALHMRTPPGPGEEGGAAETKEDAKSNFTLTAFSQEHQADFVGLDTVSECLDAAVAYERELYRRQLRLRKFILNLAAYRDALKAFGKAVWRAAA
jgi:hypothetical protein